jgi:hypothetical protein
LSDCTISGQVCTISYPDCFLTISPEKKSK